MNVRAGAWLAFALLPATVLAQGNTDPMDACYQKPDGAARLACFNQEMQRRHAASAAPAAPATPTAAAAAPAGSARPADTVGLQGAALRKKLKDDGVQEEAIRPIVATVVRVVPRPHSELAFVLDNGQTWEEVESMDNLEVKQHDSVTIKPGLFGAFFLNTPRKQRVRVHRIL